MKTTPLLRALLRCAITVATCAAAARALPADEGGKDVRDMKLFLVRDDNRRLAALQVYLGCIGPCSHAEGSQKFVHEDLHFGASPKGWSNQLDDDVLVNLNYEYRHKLWAGTAHYETSGWGRDLSVGTSTARTSAARSGPISIG